MFGLGKQAGLGIFLVELHLVHPHQPDQRVAGQDVEVDIGQRLQVLHPAHAGHHRQKQPQLGDLARLFHDVHAVQVVGDDAPLDVVTHAGMVFFDSGQPSRQLWAGTQLRPPDDGVIDVDQRLERRHQKRARTH